MKNLIIAITTLMLAIPALGNNGENIETIEGTWQTFKKDCEVTEVVKLDKVMTVRECRIRFKIKDHTCQYATVTYGTMIGKVLKRARCFLDPDTKQIEVIVKDYIGNEVSEFDAFIIGAHDGFDRPIMETKDHDDKKIFFYKLRNRN